MTITLKEIADHAGYIAAILALVSLIIPKWRELLCRAVRGVQNWAAKGRIEFQDQVIEHMGTVTQRMETNIAERDAFLKRYAADAARWDDGLAQVGEITSILKNGVSHKLALLAAQHQQALEGESRPIFVCDENGKNLLASQGYLDLLGLSDHDDLTDEQWHLVLTGELRDSYIADFHLARDGKFTLKSMADFQNPNTGEHRGRWRVIAPCVAVNNALVFTGRFIPVDDKAHEIATQFGWR